MFSSAIILVLAATISQSLAGPIEPRALPPVNGCSTNSGFPVLPNDAASNLALNRFCQIYMGQHPITKTVLSTPVVTRVTTIGSVASGVLTSLVVIPTLTETTVTSSILITPASSTTVATITSTAYLDNSGNTIAFGKRDAVPTPLAEAYIQKRSANIAVLPMLAGYGRSDLITICSCLGLSPVTYTRVLAARPSVAVVTKVLPRTTFSKLTQTSYAVSTQIDVRVITVTAPAPVATNVVYAFVPSIDSCPPNTTAAFLCPEGTGTALTSGSDGYDPNYVTCPVFAQDGYSGSCLYWNDDGQPAGSTLDQGTTGDSTKDFTRSATYGNAATDDCPSWSDYTCANNNGTLLQPMHKRSTTKATHVKQKMPAHVAGTRGSKYVHVGKH